MNLAARVEPAESPGTALLVGVATFTVSGKLAQFGNRLLGPVSDAMLTQFADNFRAAAAAIPVAAGAAAPAPGEPATAPQTVEELRPMTLLWIVVKRWWARLFGGKAA
jgi:hypothetical protein